MKTKGKHRPVAKKHTENNQISEQYSYQGSYAIPTHFILISYNELHYEETESDNIGKITDKLNDRSMQHWLIVKGLTDTAAVSTCGSLFGLTQLEIQDVLNHQHPVKIEPLESHLLVVFNSCFNEADMPLSFDHITICMKEKLIVTFQESDFQFFSNVKEALQYNRARIRKQKGDYLLSVLMNNLINNYIQYLKNMEIELGEIEDTLLEKEENEEIRELIQNKRRECVQIKQHIVALQQDFGTLFYETHSYLSAQTRPVYNDIKDHLKYAAQLLESCREMLSTLADMYIANNDLRMNSIMQRLTVVATIFIPLTFLAGVWGMNFQQIPELQWKYGYLAAWGVFIVTGVFLWWFFVRRRWF